MGRFVVLCKANQYTLAIVLITHGHFQQLMATSLAWVHECMLNNICSHQHIKDDVNDLDKWISTLMSPKTYRTKDSALALAYEYIVT